MGYLQGYLLAVYLFVGLVAGIQDELQPTKQNGAWNNNKEYHYSLTTRTVAAIPDLKNQWVGIIGAGKLTIRPQSNDVLVGKLEHVKYAQVHHELSGGWDDFIPREQLQFEPTQTNEQPFEVRLRNGAIHSIAVDKSMTNNDINQLKAALSQLQVDIRAQNLIQSVYNQLPEDDASNSQAVYKVMEPTVTGKCETLYDISPLPEYLIQTHREWAPLPELKGNGMHYKIVKTKNYEHCEQRLGYHFGLSGANEWKANTNTMGEAVSKSAVSNIIVSGKLDQYTIQSSMTVNKIIAKPGQDDQKHAEVVGAVNLTLESVHETQTRPEFEPSRLVDVGNLVYTYDLPSDPKNQVRPMGDSSEENDAQYSNELHHERKPYASHERFQTPDDSHFDDSDESKNYAIKYGQKMDSRRHPRSASEESDAGLRRQHDRKFHRHFPSSSSSEMNTDPSENHEQYHQPKPTLKRAPENPLLPMFTGYRGQSIQNAKQINVFEMAGKLVQEIATDLQNPNTIPRKSSLSKFNILSEMIRTMQLEQIEKLAKKLYVAEAEEENQNKFGTQHSNIRLAAWKVFRDAVTDAGTGPAITLSMKGIQQGKVRGERAAQMIAAWPRTIREPTEEMQRAFYEFATSESIQRQANVNTTALISMTRFFNMAQVSNNTARNYYPVDSFGRLADRHNRLVNDKVIPYLAQKLNEAAEQQNGQHVLVYIRALGNLGHEAILRVFEPYLEGKKAVTDFQRLAMVVALDQYKLNYPKTARSVLYKIYQNAGERHELRVAALFQLMLTKPDAAMLQRLAEQANSEPNPHVRSAVSSAIKTASELETLEYLELAADARAAAQLLPKESLGVQYSRTSLHDFVVKELNAAYGHQISWIIGEDSLLPSGVFAEIGKNLGGFKHRTEYQAMVTSIDRLISLFHSQLKPLKTNELPRNARKGQSPFSFEQLFNLEANEAEQLEGQMWFSIFNTKRFVTFDNQTIENWPHHVRKMAAALKKGYKVDEVKLFNNEVSTISFPLETGLPYIYSKHVPMLYKVNGMVYAHSMPELADGSKDVVQVPKTMNMSSEIDIVYSKSVEASVGFFNPADHQRYEAGYTHKMQGYAPLRFSVNIDLVNHEMESEIRPREASKRATILHLSTWPYTARYDILAMRPVAESEHKKLIHVRSERPFNFTFGERSTGFAFTIQGSHEKDIHQIGEAWKALTKFNKKSLWVLAQVMSTPEMFSLDVNFEPERSTAESAKFRIAHNSGWTDIKGKNILRTHSKSHNAQGNLAILPSSIEADAHQRRAELLRNAAIDFDYASTEFVEIAMEFYGKGQKKAEYVSDFALAKNFVNDKSRMLVFVSGKNGPKESKPKAYQMCIHAETEHKAAPEMNFEDALNYPKNDGAVVVIAYGEKCNSDAAAQIKLNAQLRQTEEYQQNLRATPLAKMALKQMLNGNNQLPAGKIVTGKAHILDEVDVSVTFERMTPILRRHLMEMFTSISGAALPYITKTTFRNEDSNKIDLHARFAPALEVLNLTVATPIAVFELELVPMPDFVWPIINRRLGVRERLHRYAIRYQDTCVIDDNQLSTFDNRTINHQFGNTWHVAMKAQPKNAYRNEYMPRAVSHHEHDDEYITILVRDSWYSPARFAKNFRGNQPMNKDVNIYVGDELTRTFDLIKLRPITSQQTYAHAHSPRVFINDKEVIPTGDKRVVVYPTEESIENKLVRAYATPEGEIHMIVRSGRRELKITYDGERVKVQADSSFRKNVEGICGRYTGRADTDMQTPDNCIVRGDQDFIASWALLEGTENDGPAKERAHEARNAKCVPQKFLYGNVISEQEAGRRSVQRTGHQYGLSALRSSFSSSKATQTSQSSEESTTTDRLCQANHQTIYEYVNGKICFSQRVLPACPTGCNAEEFVERSVAAVCRPEDDTAALHYVAAIQRGKNMSFDAEKVNGKFTYKTPSKCIRA